MKKKRKVGKIILWVVVGILVSIIALIVIINVCVYNSRSSGNNQVSGNQTETELIIDANQFLESSVSSGNVSTIVEP